MKADMSTKIYKNIFGHTQNHENVNKFLKAVIINFGDERGDIVVYNDNFGTRRKYADFTEGKKAAGLHPMQIVFCDVEWESLHHTKYINENDEICVFGAENNDKKLPLPEAREKQVSIVTSIDKEKER